jgi:SpoVK/Ycf46/Vps4 family AAA+-type ATPase
VLLRTAPHCLEASHITALASSTHGFVGADLQLLVKESALQALRRWRNTPQGDFPVSYYMFSLNEFKVATMTAVVIVLLEVIFAHKHSCRSLPLCALSLQLLAH